MHTLENELEVCSTLPGQFKIQNGRDLSKGGHKFLKRYTIPQQFA